MARVAGVQVTKTNSGKLKSVTFDLKKHGDKINPILQELGIIVEDDFEVKWRKGGLTPEQLKEKLVSYVHTLPWKNQQK